MAATRSRVLAPSGCTLRAPRLGLPTKRWTVATPGLGLPTNSWTVATPGLGLPTNSWTVAAPGLGLPTNSCSVATTGWVIAPERCRAGTRSSPIWGRNPRRRGGIRSPRRPGDGRDPGRERIHPPTVSPSPPSRRKPGSSLIFMRLASSRWIPAFAGTTRSGQARPAGPPQPRMSSPRASCPPVASFTSIRPNGDGRLTAALCRLCPHDEWRGVG